MNRGVVVVASVLALVLTLAMPVAAQEYADGYYVSVFRSANCTGTAASVTAYFGGTCSRLAVGPVLGMAAVICNFTGSIIRSFDARDVTCRTVVNTTFFPSGVCMPINATHAQMLRCGADGVALRAAAAMLVVLLLLMCS